ncbi:738_t:CDS:2 [Rhizophagus irregularis]|nr:738_t:CDS:2 [Rhizophagus irregularis]
MSLVADYGSDISSSEEENDIQNIETETTVTTVTKKRSLTSLLPPPKNKRNGPVKIVVDLPKSVKDDEDDSEKDQSSKKSKSSGSDLFALLPAPKRPITGKEQKSSTNKPTDLANKPTTASTSFVPHTLTKRKSVAQKNSNLSQTVSKIKGKEVKVHSDDEETKDKANFTESFFPLDYYYDGSQLQQQSSEQAQPDSQIDDEVIQKLGGRRGKEGPIIIKEINAADQMADAWQAQMGELTKPGRGGSGGTHFKPTKGQKRKHNLMYLAYQAAAMENDLKEQFAANKKTKRETQAKYGYYDLFVITRALFISITNFISFVLQDFNKFGINNLSDKTYNTRFVLHCF